jgi:hypothetical protein
LRARTLLASTLILTGLIVSGFLAIPPATAEQSPGVLEIKYDNGLPSGSGYGHVFGSGLGVRFTPLYPRFELTGARFYLVPQVEGSQLNFTLRVEDVAHNVLSSFMLVYTVHNVPLSGPWGSGTVLDVDLSSRHVVVSGDFYIFAINHHCLFVDTSPVGSWRNYYYDGLGNYTQYEKYGEDGHEYGNLMIRAYGFKEREKVALKAGWNLVSLPLVPNDPSISKVLAAQTAAKEVVVVWSYTGTPRTWKFFIPSKSSTLSAMVDGDAYWIYMRAVNTLYVDGYVIAPTRTPPTYALVTGWNLVGFKPQPNIANETVGAYLSSITGSYDPNNVWVFDNSGGNWIRATDSTWLRPGDAIWIFVTAPTTLRP